MLNLEQQFKKHLNSKSYQSIAHLPFFVGFSGGVDSLVLLYLLKKHFGQKKITAIHFNHQINPQAQKWAQFCQDFCHQQQIDLIQKKLVIAKTKHLTSYETIARKERYQKFIEIMPAKSVLFLAHHQDDQIETFLFRLFRGAYFKGLASMDEHSSVLHSCILLKRPFLNLCNKVQLIEFAQTNKLIWLEDPSNQDLHIKRNLIRHQILPKLQSIHPNAKKALLNQIDNFKQSDQLLTDLAIIDSQKAIIKKSLNQYLSLTYLQNLDKVRLANLLYYYAAKNWHLFFASQKQLNYFIEKFIFNSSTEHQINNLTFLKYANLLLVLKDNQLICTKKQSLKLKNKLKVKPNHGYLTYQKVRQNEIGLNIDCINQLEITLPKPKIKKIKLINHKQQQKLKNLFADCNIPAFLRDNYPFLSIKNNLVALPNIGFCDQRFVKKQIDDPDKKLQAINLIWHYW